MGNLDQVGGKRKGEAEGEGGRDINLNFFRKNESFWLSNVLLNILNRNIMYQFFHVQTFRIIGFGDSRNERAGV